MGNWDNKLFSDIIKKCADMGIFREENNTKEAVYKYISGKLYSSPDTVKGWIRTGSNGPKDKKLEKDLEELLNVKFYKEEVTMERGAWKNMGKYSDFTKSQIMEIYSLMKDYITSDKVENEEEYHKMRLEINKKQIAIPEDLYVKIIEFADSYLEPIIYDYENTFATSRSRDIGYLDKAGVFKIETEEQLIKCIGGFIEAINKIEHKLDEFAQKELYPILTQ